MKASRLTAPRLLIAACHVAASGFLFASAPAAAEPFDPAPHGPSAGGSDVIPAVGVLEGMWRQYVPRDAAPPDQMASVDRFFSDFVPKPAQIGDLFAFLEHFRGPMTNPGGIS
ncbi:hypothetical protein A5698_21245 [Mycobacterium sp. E136]|uniref:hypothetical protein n=1 Tax=Mycobacterium sp. E136 TaxID=1834125 RepID=UPI0008001599|nr:hypothetical protein [Mycobacterium sp. E136]OBG91117.1 hypothetical protein A5698_21245 [Mycobacterium sp. E136]